MLSCKVITSVTKVLLSRVCVTITGPSVFLLQHGEHRRVQTSPFEELKSEEDTCRTSPALHYDPSLHSSAIQLA